jgi:Fe2+ or Zn2+ uptake regulation protein
MKKAIHEVLTPLVIEKGGRITRQRRAIYDFLASQHVPVSLQDIARSVSAHEVSVYRTIRFFAEEGLVEEISFPDGTKRYALGKHHHHAICRLCGFTEHMPCDHLEYKKSPRFAMIEKHEVTFIGLCTACAT